MIEIKREVMYLLAEIHNKISQTGSNLSDRLEDKLTGDFFGTIRYLPFEQGLKHVLTTAEFSQEHSSKTWLDFIQGQKGYIGQMEFWYRDDVEGEIDLLITTEQAVIGVEVKYLSGLSTEDEDDGSSIDYTESVNQLARYSRILEKISVGRDAYLLFLAPFEMMNRVKKNMTNRTITSPSVGMGFLCWEDILESLQHLSLDELEKGQQFILNDVQALLLKKEFIRFNGFYGRDLNQPITKSAYSFTLQDGSAGNWSWPSKSIRKDVSYVYNNR
jgi:hypothetical protein